MGHEVKRLIVGPIETNVYIVKDTETGEAAVIDPAEYSSELEAEIEAIGRENVKYIFLTHRHFDHIMGVYELKRRTGAKIAISRPDAAALTDAEVSESSRVFPGRQKYVEPDIVFDDGDVIEMGSLRFTFIITPGHTSGSSCIILDDIIFSGDTLFKDSVGRTDMKSGDYGQILKSAARLAGLSGNYKVYPGHGETTTLDRERKYNPYMGNNNNGFIHF